MHWVVITLIVIAVPWLFAWGNHQSKKQHAAFTKSDVMAAIEDVLSDGYHHDEWEMFLAWPIGDSYLESVRQRCIAISNEYSGTEKGKDIATNGEAKLHLVLDELKNRA